MKKTVKYSIMAAFAVTLGIAASVTQAQTSSDRVYAIDGRNEVVTSGANLCWRTGFWTPAAAAKDPAGCQCDKDIIEKSICEPKTVTGKTTPPTVKTQPGGGKLKLAADTLFDFDKAVLKPAGKEALDQVAAKAQGVNLEVITAVGHTDRIGSKAYNQKLSERRAAAVKTYLVSKGIPANRIYTEGKGLTQPVTKPGDCKGPKSKKVIECLQPDRRVDVELIGTAK